MQWLIDIVAARVIDTIGIPPVYIDRGDPIDVDFRWLNHLFFPTLTVLDLSGIIPENTSAVCLYVVGLKNAVGSLIELRTHGNANPANASAIITQVANIHALGDCVVKASPSREIDMRCGGIWTEILITVKGWWL